MSFSCVVCKNTFEGEPHTTNGVGTICRICRDEMTRKQTEKIRALHAATDGVCKYCGDKAEAFAGTKDDTIHVCKKCTGMIIPHVLKCIRYSDKMAKYVASREEKESPARNARDAARLIVATKKQEIKDPEDRITRLEGMIEELLQHITKPK